MLKILRILCPIDFSEFSERAYDYAQSLAHHYKAELFLEHVVQLLTAPYPYYAFPESIDRIRWNVQADGEKQLQEFVKLHTRNGTHIERVVQEGVVTDSILSLATQHSVDLIVMGTHGRRGFDRLTVGSVTEKVLRKACCPVLAVRKPAHDFANPQEKENQVQLRKILFCTDFSAHSDRASFYAFSLAQEYRAELTLLHVLEDIPDPLDIQSVTAQGANRLRSLVPLGASHWCGAKTIIRVGKPYQEIIQLGLEAQTDLVVMGVRGRNALDLALFGSTTHRVLQLGSCPVLTVRI